MASNSKQPRDPRKPRNTVESGHIGEQEALQFLRKRGLLLVTQNFRCKMGEIDLIMRDTDTLVFVEVRLRQTENYESGADSITRSKINKILRTAEYYLLENPQPSHTDFRFDVVSIGSSIDWIQEAFTADAR